MGRDRKDGLGVRLGGSMMSRVKGGGFGCVDICMLINIPNPFPFAQKRMISPPSTAHRVPSLQSGIMIIL